MLRITPTTAFTRGRYWSKADAASRNAAVHLRGTWIVIPRLSTKRLTVIFGLRQIKAQGGGDGHVSIS